MKYYSVSFHPRYFQLLSFLFVSLACIIVLCYSYFSDVYYKKDSKMELHSKAITANDMLEKIYNSVWKASVLS